MSGYLFSKWFRIRECPNHFHETHIMIIRNSCKINHSTHPCGHSNIRLCGHANTKAQGLFPHSYQTSVSKIAHFIKSYKHPRHSGKSFVVFTLQLHIYFFSKTFCILICEFPPKKTSEHFFFRSMLVFFFFFLFQFLQKKVCNLGKVVTRDYTYQKEQRVHERKETIHKTLLFCLVFLFQTNHHNAIARRHIGSDKVSSQ